MRRLVRALQIDRGLESFRRLESIPSIHLESFRIRRQPGQDRSVRHAVVPCRQDHRVVALRDHFGTIAFVGRFQRRIQFSNA